MAVPPSQEDEAKMRDILSDPEVMKVLQDHQIQRLLTMMKSNPEAAQLWVVLQELTNCLWFSKIFQVSSETDPMGVNKNAEMLILLPRRTNYLFWSYWKGSHKWKFRDLVSWSQQNHGLHFIWSSVYPLNQAVWTLGNFEWLGSTLVY